MADVGLVALDTDGKWIGGRYYLQHLIKAVATLPHNEQIPMSDIWWQEPSNDDPFAEVRDLLSRRVVVRYPVTLAGRARRKFHRLVNRVSDARDLFLNAGIGVLFPVLPCEAPGVPYVFWLSDFQYLELPGLFGEKLCQWYADNNRKNVSVATLIVLSSQHAYRTLQEVFPDAASRARVVRFCSVPDATWWKLDPRSAAAAKGLDRFLLFSNQFTHHKNHEIVLEAVRILRDRGTNVQVVCTGSTYGFRGGNYFDRLRAFIDEHHLDSNVHILGMVPREEHAALMRRSVAMIQPSRFEGWSTAVEDAKTLGKTLLVSDIDVHREQLGSKHPMYINVDDAEEWAKAMLTVWSSGTPGPHENDEAVGLKQLQLRARETGYAFISVMSEAMTSA
jgi:glycosyltransferase involved in cell wall biosynthesis